MLRQREEHRTAVMADYSSVAPPSSNAGGGMNDAFKDALQRARQVRISTAMLFFNNLVVGTKKNRVFVQLNNYSGHYDRLS